MLISKPLFQIFGAGIVLVEDRVVDEMFAEVLEGIFCSTSTISREVVYWGWVFGGGVGRMMGG
jgi:hypothetical protein